MIRKYSFLLMGILLAFGLQAQNIDLSNWKITIPKSRKDNPNKPIEVSPPEIKDFENNEDLKPYFYRDPEDGALVFYAYP
ncbi:MAG: polysaccharide lyase family 7 protein, partial [Bacteroidota bacterium]